MNLPISTNSSVASYLWFVCVGVGVGDSNHSKEGLNITVGPPEHKVIKAPPQNPSSK